MLSRILACGRETVDVVGRGNPVAHVVTGAMLVTHAVAVGCGAQLPPCNVTIIVTFGYFGV
jgi:hypothetical protein